MSCHADCIYPCLGTSARRLLHWQSPGTRPDRRPLGLGSSTEPESPARCSAQCRGRCDPGVRVPRRGGLGPLWPGGPAPTLALSLRLLRHLLTGTGIRARAPSRCRRAGTCGLRFWDRRGPGLVESGPFQVPRPWAGRSSHGALSRSLPVGKPQAEHLRLVRVSG